MGEHDAASIVGLLAGLTGGEDQTPPEKVTPAQLVKAFCGDDAAGLAADPGVTEQDGGVTSARGWCGYRGIREDNPLLVGFDDGYEFMGYLSERGWLPLPAKGDWPYLVYMLTEQDGSYAVAEYCEADLVVTMLPTQEQTAAFYAGLREAP
jgi:hypothetical protein